MLLEKNNNCYYHLGRNAIYAACKIFNISEEDEILTPAWDCFETLEPFRVLGAKCIFYKIDPYTFQVDLKHIESIITNKTKLIHIINYFGFPQPWDEILQLREKTNIPILEDNAYSLSSTYHDKEIGSFGDCSIFSLRKTLTIPSGGVLRINSEKNH